ncbi:hypothetical protein ACFQ3Z_01820 [Streptomyces nogalater]
MDPVALPDGGRLPRNTHRLTAELPTGRKEMLVNDSPLDNALRTAVARLLGDTPPPPWTCGPYTASAPSRTASDTTAASPRPPPGSPTEVPREQARLRHHRLRCDRRSARPGAA